MKKLTITGLLFLVVAAVAAAQPAEIDIAYVNSGVASLDQVSQEAAADVVVRLNEGSTGAFHYNLVIVDSQAELNDYAESTTHDVYSSAHGQYTATGNFTGLISTSVGFVDDITWTTNNETMGDFYCGEISLVDNNTGHVGSIYFDDMGILLAQQNGQDYSSQFGFTLDDYVYPDDYYEDLYDYFDDELYEDYDEWLDYEREWYYMWDS